MVALNNGSSVFMQTLMYMMNQSMIQQQETSYNYYYVQIGKETNATKCYGSYGCFQLLPPWTSETRPVSLFPEDIQKIEPRFSLYTRINPISPTYIDLNEYDYIETSGIQFDKPIFVVTHGFVEGGHAVWIKNMLKALLKLEDCNVIVVDWQGGSSPPYTQAVANTRLVGVIAASLIGDITKMTGTLDNVHCIGHSLGAHLCGYIGFALQKEFNSTLGRITGMDPAEPHFAKSAPPVRLDRSAAKYVDIIHTDASQFIKGGLGLIESIGHVDYYPNGGKDQPGCTKSVLQYIKDANGSFFNGVKKYLSCNHIRAHEFFLESITPNPRCKFMTISCDSYQDFVSGKCFDCGIYGENCIPFGYHGRKYYEKYWGKRRRHDSRIQYLMTKENPPFCQGHYRITVQISDSKESKQHGGEIGQLIFIFHSTSDGTGIKSAPVGFISGFHEPGATFRTVIPGDEIPKLKAVEIEWKYNSSFLNPLTWRILTTPKIYLRKITIESLELNKKLIVCPQNSEPLISGIPQMMIASYC